MIHISELSDIGKGKQCLIVGGGESLNRFQWDRLQNTYVICLNNHLSQMADMIIYYDENMQKYYTKHDVSKDTILMGFRHSDALDHTCNQCTHYYSYTDMVYGDGGFHALQFADKIFNFEKIYLIGYDYKTNGDSYHHDEEHSDPESLEKFEQWSIGKVLGRYGNIGWTNTIYNCSDSSALNMFTFGLPY